MTLAVAPAQAVRSQRTRLAPRSTSLSEPLFLSAFAMFLKNGLIMFNTSLRLLAVLASGLCLLNVAVAQDSSMSPDEIKQTWVDKKVFSRAPSGAFMDFYIRSRLSPKLPPRIGPTRAPAPSDNGYCTTWKKIRPGSERCFTVMKQGTSVVVLNPDQSVAAEVLKVVD